ncbi:unnamed protein product [Knipowitschia caucasica]
MEDYEKFVELRLSQLKMTEDTVEDKPKVPSLICFYGRPILPPLVSEAQKKEMTRLKEAAQTAAANRNHKDDPRMSYVQTILRSVDIRKTPTLEELLKESEIDNQSLPGDNGSLSQGPCANESLSLPFTPTEMVVESVHPLTSTTCCSPETLHLPLMRHNFPQVGDPGLDSCFKADSHQISPSYDLFTNDNAVSAKCSHRIYVELFSNHKSLATLKEVPYIINYPPVDGEELERSGHEASFGIDLRAENPESISFIDVRSADDSQSVKNKHKEYSQLPSGNDQELKVADDLTNLPTVTQLPNSLKEKHTPLSETMQTEDTDSKPSEEHYRMSLQALLKKSQECRQRQRMLRNQGKSAKIQDRAQDQPKSEEQSLSDKENDEHHTKGTEPRNSQERSHSSIVDQSLKRSYESDRRSDNIYDKPHLTIDNHAQDCVLDHNYESSNFIKMNNWVNRGEQRNVSSPAPIWTEDVCKSSESSANTSPTDLTNVKKYHDIPALNFCKSPVPCKVKSPSAPFDKTSQKSVVINMSMNNNKVREDNSSTSPVNDVGSDVTSVLAKSSQHIDQLEFNLSGLKVLISDLESTLTENVDTRSSQSESQQTSTSQNDSLNSLGDVHAQKSHLPEIFKGNNDKSPLVEIKTKTVPSQQLVKTASGEKDHTGLTHTQNIRRPPSAKSSLSTGQKMRIPGAFRTCLVETTTQKNQPVLSDASDQNGKTDSDVGHDSSCTSLNQSYDVDTPSELWLNCLFEEKHMTPESGGEGQRSKVKRRLQMTEGIPAKEDEQAERRASTSKAAAQWHEGLDGVKERQAQLRQIHAAQIRALQDQHQRQQEQLLQALAVRYSLLQSVSLPCSVSTSRLGDTLTFPTLSQLPLPVHYRHLLSAIAKGFLTRRLLKTERVAQLVRTARDTHQFLQAFQKHSPNKGLPSRQDLFLQERVTLQLRAARYEIHDIFFSLSPREKMQLISIDRDLARERAFKQQNAHGGKQRGKGTLSAATQKSLERKSAVMMYKKSAERHRGAGTRLRHKPGLSAEQSLETRAGQHRANPQRVPKSTYTSRPR